MFYFYRNIIHPCRLSKTEEQHRGSAHLTAALSVLDQFLHWENVESGLIKCVMSSFSLSLSQDSEFVCLEFDEAKVNQVLKKMADIQQSIDSIVQRT